MKKVIRFVSLLCLLANVCLAQTSKIPALEAKLKKSQPDTNRLRLLQQIGDAYTAVDLVKKLAYGKEQFELAQKLGSEKWMCDALVQMGISYASRSKLDSGLIFFQQAYDHAEKVNYLQGMGKATMDMGFCYDRLDNEKEAIKYDFKALNLLKAAKNQKGVNQLLINIGSIYFDLRKYAIAETYFRECLISYKAMKDTAGIAYGLFTVADCLQALHKDDEALKYFDQSLAIRTKLEDNNGVALVKRGMGKAYFHKKDYTKSLDYLKAALTTVQQLKNRYEETAFLLDLSDTYLAINDYTNAIDCAEKAVKYAKEMKSQSGASEGYERLISIYKKQGNYKELAKYQARYIDLQDTVLNAKALRDITLEEFSRVRDENLALTKDKAQIESANLTNVARLNEYSSAIVIIAVVLISVVILTFVLYRSNREKQLTNARLLAQTEEIAAINRELESVNEELHTQSELTSAQNAELERLNAVKNKFFSIVSHDLRGPLATLQTLFSIYREGDIGEEELGMLLTRFEDTLINTSAFLDNLLEWSKNQLEGMIVKPIDFDIAECITDTVHLFETRIAMKELKIDISGVAPLSVHGDKNMIGLVIRNLLSNSVKFCSAGDEISFATSKQGDMVVISLHDTGPGISEADREKLFSLEHVLSSGSQGEKGNHLGLILCRDMVLQNKGSIRFESAEGEGTTFWVELPASA